MFATFYLFFLLFALGLKETVGLKRCPSLREPRHGSVVCLRGKKRLSCGSGLPVGSVAEFACREFYKLSPEDRSFLKCRSNGNWSSSAPNCIPDCGRRQEQSVSLIVKGSVVSRGDFPWHAAIYYLVDGNYEYWCGGSLISEAAVVTAAHCVWEIPAGNLMLAFGKIHREFNLSEESTQRRKARRIETLSSYQDVAGNYNGDIAVIFLRERVRVGRYCLPVCVDWEQRLTEKQLSEGTSGVVPGWGLTENDTLGDSLRAARLPVVSDEKCISEQERDFKKFVTYTTFCAGYADGRGVCNGDSGGGLAFFDAVSNRWYLQGLVSVSPRRKGTPYCDLNFYTVFTKVSAFSKWLNAVRKWEIESSGEPVEDSVPKGKLQDSRPAVVKHEESHVGFEKQIIFSHTKKMLELAGLFNPSQKPRSAARFVSEGRKKKFLPPSLPSPFHSIESSHDFASLSR